MNTSWFSVLVFIAIAVIAVALSQWSIKHRKGWRNKVPAWRRWKADEKGWEGWTGA